MSKIANLVNDFLPKKPVQILGSSDLPNFVQISPACGKNI